MTMQKNRGFLRMAGLGAMVFAPGVGAAESGVDKEPQFKAIVARWFKEFWGNSWNVEIVDELAAPDMLLQYSLHRPRREREVTRRS